MEPSSNAEAGPSRLSPVERHLKPTEPLTGFEKWRTSLAMFTGLGLTENQKAERELEIERRKLEKDWDLCEKRKAQLMQRSPMVVFMLKHLELAGCPFTSDHLQCHPCPPTSMGGFAPEYGVLLCQNRFISKKRMEETLAHELIHAFDHCRFKVDWSNLRHHACTEIRAANLSGDCRWGNEVERGFYAFNKHHQACVKRRAIISVEVNPACESREQAEKVVNEVWTSCFKDTRPFDEIY